MIIQSSWTVNPFGAEVKDGRIYGRGAQDMKCVCVQYLVALQRLRQQFLLNGAERPLRTVRLAWVPDEEIGGTDGMGIMLESAWFKSFAVGIALDEVSWMCCFAQCHVLWDISLRLRFVTISFQL
jgi:aminoacylase